MNVTLEQSSESELSLIFHGCTWQFRDVLEDAGLTASRYEEDGAWKYVHVLNVNVAREEDIARLEKAFEETLKSLACRMLDAKTLRGEVKAFVERLGEEHEQLHFV